MIKYHKINSVFKRDDKGKFLPRYSQPEFQYLALNNWVGTEKVDGMNIRVIFQYERLSFNGRNENSQIPPLLHRKLLETFNVKQMATVFGQSANVCLYGEGYGTGIQNGGKYTNNDGVDFVLFDVMIEHLWLERSNILDVANKLGIKAVPQVFIGTLRQATETVQAGLVSTWGDFLAEGLVLKPQTELRDRRGYRIITKVKSRDFI